MIYDVGLKINGQLYVEVIASNDKEAREKALSYLSSVSDISYAEVSAVTTEIPPEKNKEDYSSHEEEVYQ
ncbi:MAG: hypothetical protein ACI4NM_09715 [Bullifex sp.]